MKKLDKTIQWEARFVPAGGPALTTKTWKDPTMKIKITESE